MIREQRQRRKRKRPQSQSKYKNGCIFTLRCIRVIPLTGTKFIEKRKQDGKQQQRSLKPFLLQPQSPFQTYVNETLHLTTTTATKSNSHLQKTRSRNSKQKRSENKVASSLTRKITFGYIKEHWHREKQ